jgi:hypothetical protein
MQHPGYELRRTLLLGTSVNKARRFNASATGNKSDVILGKEHVATVEVISTDGCRR